MTPMTNPPKKIIPLATLAYLRQRFFMRKNSTTNSLRCSPRRLRLRHKGAPQPTRLSLRRRQLVILSTPVVAHRLSPIAPLSRASATRAPSSWLAKPSRFRARARSPFEKLNGSPLRSASRSAASSETPLPPPLASAWRTRARLAPLRGAFFSNGGRAEVCGVVVGVCVVAASRRSSDAWPCRRVRLAASAHSAAKRRWG